MPKIIVVHYEEDPAAIAAFKNNVTHIWSDSVNYTKDAIVSAFESGADLPAITARLTKNQEDIANVLVPYYGQTVALQLAAILKAHEGIVTRAINAAKAGTDLTALQPEWHNSNQDIANFLNGLDPVNWSAIATLVGIDSVMIHTLAEINAKVTKNPTAFIQEFDANRNVTNQIADYYANGIVTKFPDHFVLYTTPPPATSPLALKAAMQAAPKTM